MPSFYRIEQRRYAGDAFSGIGGLFSAGRWHRKGARVAYASEHPGVSAMEKRVWLGSLADALVEDFVVIPVEIPTRCIEVVDPAGLPDGWDGFPHIPETQEIGMRWLREARSAALQVPSVVVPRSVNVVINPAHPDAGRFTTGGPDPFDWDPRLF